MTEGPFSLASNLLPSFTDLSANDLVKNVLLTARKNASRFISSAPWLQFPSRPQTSVSARFPQSLPQTP